MPIKMPQCKLKAEHILLLCLLINFHVIMCVCSIYFWQEIDIHACMLNITNLGHQIHINNVGLCVTFGCFLLDQMWSPLKGGKYGLRQFLTSKRYFKN